MKTNELQKAEIKLIEILVVLLAVALVSGGMQ